MALAIALKKFFYHTITIAPRSGYDEYAKPTYGTTVSYKAKIEQSGKLVMNQQGEEVVGRYTIYLDTTTPPDVNGNLTMPTGFETVNQIIAVRPVTDHNGINHVIVET